MSDTPVPSSQAGVVNGALLEAAAKAVEDSPGDEEDEAPAYKGVCRTRTNRFTACAGRGAKHAYLGTFGSAEEAARAFDAHARSQGDKAVNFPNAEAGEVKAVKGEASATTLKRAAGGAVSAAPNKRAATGAGAAAAPSPAAPPLAKPQAPAAKAATRPPPRLRGPPSAAAQSPHPSSPPPSPQQPTQQQQQLQQQPQPPTLPPPPALLPPQPPTGGGHAAPLQLPPPPGASPEEAFIASLSLADPAGVLGRMRTKNITLSYLVDAMRPGVADDMRQELWRDLFAELGVVDVGERIAVRFALARMQ